MSHNRSYGRKEVEEAFRQIPSCKDNTIPVSELGTYFELIGFAVTKQQFEEYTQFWSELFDGKIQLDVAAAIFAVHSDLSKLMEVCVVACDKDKDGFINEGEFKSLIEILLLHDPDYPRVRFENFVAEADTNKDGKVSIEEALAWFTKDVKK